MEDFGYSKEQQEQNFGILVKRSALFGAALFSIVCFIYITMSAYRYFANNGAAVELIEPAADPIKIVVEGEVEQKNSAIKIDGSIYEDIFGTRKKKERKIKVKKVEKAPLPPKPVKIVKKKKLPVVYVQDEIPKGIKVQLAALSSKENAYRYFSQLKRKYPKLFSGHKDYIQKVDLGKRGVFYRVQVGNFYDQIRAEDFCAKYVAKALKERADCIVVE